MHPADHTARVQTVWKDLNPSFHALIEAFGRMTGRYVLLNTSFNLHGFPIVAGACDAVEVLLRSGLDYLVIDRWLVTKRGRLEPVPASSTQQGREAQNPISPD